MQLAKLDNGLLISTYADDEDKEMINLMVGDGFKIYIEDEIPTTEFLEFQSLKLCYREEPHQIVGYYEVTDNSPVCITIEIDRLKDELSSTDYQVIKAYEYALANQPIPCDVATLHAERQSIRNRINELKKLCKNEG